MSSTFCSLIRSFHFIEAESKKGKGREGSSCRLRVCSGLSAVLGLLHKTKIMPWSQFMACNPHGDLSRKTHWLICQWTKLENGQAIMVESDFEPLSILNKPILFPLRSAFSPSVTVRPHRASTIQSQNTDCYLRGASVADVRKRSQWLSLTPVCKTKEAGRATLTKYSGKSGTLLTS